MGFISRLFLQCPSLKDFFGVLDAQTTVPESGRARSPYAHGEVALRGGHLRLSAGARHRRTGFRARPGTVVALVGIPELASPAP